MKHKWDAGETFMDAVASQCTVCGGWRYRKRVAGLDYINTPTMSLDVVGKTDRGWTLDEDTPRSCPGAPELPTDEELAGMLERGEIG